MTRLAPSPEELEFNAVLGNAIRYWRTQRGWSQCDLAEVSGIRQSFICRIEQGKVSVTFFTALCLFNALEIQARDVFQILAFDTSKRQNLRR